MARKERFVNNAATTLNGGINDTVTSLVVTSASGFPTEGDFRILIGAEILLVTAVSGTTFTVVRGADGSTAGSHSNLASVTAIVTKGSLEQYARDNDPWVNLRPPLRIIDTNGVALDSSDFTELNFAQNAASSDEDGNITITKDDHAGDSQSCLTRSAPTAPYTITAGFTFQILGDAGVAGPHAGLLFAGDPTDNMITNSYQPGNPNSNRVLVFTSPTTFSSQIGNAEPTYLQGVFWMRIEDDNTDLKFYSSRDGVHWQFLTQQGRGVSFTTAPDRVGFFISNIAGIDGSSVSLVAWDGE